MEPISMPKIGDVYYSMGFRSSGTVNTKYFFANKWCNTKYDVDRFNNGNCFSTEKAVQGAINKLIRGK